MNYYRLWYNIKQFPNNCKYGIINLINYFSIVWNDRDWDNAFTEKFLIFKLKRQAKYISKNERFVGWEREVQKINTVISLLQKDHDEFYGMEYYDYYKQNMRWEDSKEFKNCKQLEFDLVEDNSPAYFLKHVAAWKRLSKDPEITDNLKMCLLLGRDRQQKCHDLAWELIKRNIQRWWD